MKLLVTGGRDYADRAVVYAALDAIHARTPITHLINGGGLGLDTLAHHWALIRGVQPVCCEANWDYYCKPAGPRRNQKMAELEPHLLAAFPGGVGTANMISIAKRLNIEIEEIK